MVKDAVACAAWDKEQGQKRSCEGGDYFAAARAGVPLDCRTTPDEGDKAEMKCTVNVLWVEVNAGLDYAGWNEAKAIFRGTGTVLLKTARWAFHGVVKAPQNAAVSMVEAGAKGEIHNEYQAAGNGFLGYASGIVPGLGTALSVPAAVDACGNPGGGS
jgi:hypothetical protein